MTNDTDTKAVIRAGNELESIFQIWPSSKDAPNTYPYDEMGLRIVGGKEVDSGKIVAQAVRFSQDPRFNWNDSNVLKWIEGHGYELKQSLKHVSSPRLKTLLRDENHAIYKQMPMEIKSIENKDTWVPGQGLMLLGVVSSSSVDVHGEVVEPEAIMESHDFYMKYATVRYMHQADPIGKTTKLWKEGEKVFAKMYISASAISVIQRILEGIIHAFSIGFLWIDGEYKDVSKDSDEPVKVWHYTKIRLVEISPVDSPANRDADLLEISPSGKLSSPLISESLIDEIPFEELASRVRTTHVSDKPPSIQIPKDLIGINVNSTSSDTSPQNYEVVSVKMTDAPSGGIEMENEPATEEVEVEEAPAEEPSEPITSEPETSEADPEPEKSDTADILKRLKALEKENAAFKAAEEKRKEQEKLDAAIKTATAPLEKKNAELEKALSDATTQLAAKEAFENGLDGRAVRRDSFGGDPGKTLDAHGVPLDTAEADEKMAKSLRRIAGYQ